MWKYELTLIYINIKQTVRQLYHTLFGHIWTEESRLSNQTKRVYLIRENRDGILRTWFSSCPCGVWGKRFGAFLD